MVQRKSFSFEELSVQKSKAVVREKAAQQPYPYVGFPVLLHPLPELSQAFIVFVVLSRDNMPPHPVTEQSIL